MEVDTTEAVNISMAAVKPQIPKKRGQLTDEQHQALRTLGACFYCQNTGHVARNCPEKPQRQGGQDRRALPGNPLFRAPPPTKNRSTEVKGETIVLTQENFHKEIMKLNKDDHALIIRDLLEQGF